LVSRLERIVRTIDRFQQSHAILGFPFAIIQKFGNDRAGAFATRIAYRGLFALFPMLLLLTTALGYVLSGHPHFRARVLDSALGQFPVIDAQLRNTAHPLEGSGVGLVVGAVGTVWGSLGIGLAAESAMNTLWNVPYVRWPSFLLRRARAAAFVAGLGLAALLSAALSIVASFATGFGEPLAYAASVTVSFGVFVAAFIVLTAEDLRWRDVVIGAAIATVFWQALQAIGGWYMARELRGGRDVYGFLAVAIALLSWMFLAAQLTLLAVEINVVRKYRLWPRSMTQPPLTDADREVFARLARAERRRPEYDVAVVLKPEANQNPLVDQGDGGTPTVTSAQPDSQPSNMS
jgi:YihY family inner membrane protein